MDRPGAPEGQSRPSFFLDVGIGYGLSYGSTVGFSYVMPEDDPKLETYLQRLGLKLSENGVTLRVTGTYSISERLGVYSVVPYGMVSERDDSRLPGLVEVEVAPGDVGFGLYYSALNESKHRTKILLNLDYSTNTAEHTSLGDGVDNIIGGVDLRRYVTDGIFVTGRADYGLRGKKNGVDVGDTAGIGLGLGFLGGSGKAKVHFQLKYTAVEEAKLGRTTLLDAYDDLSLTMSTYSIFARSDVSMYLTRLNDLDWKQSTVGFNWSFNMLPR